MNNSFDGTKEQWNMLYENREVVEG